VVETAEGDEVVVTIVVVTVVVVASVAAAIVVDGGGGPPPHAVTTRAATSVLRYLIRPGAPAAAVHGDDAPHSSVASRMMLAAGFTATPPRHR